MTRAVSPTVRRVSALLLLGALVFVAVTAVILPIMDADQRSREDVARLQDDLARLSEVAGSLDAVVAAKASAARRDGAGEFYLKEAVEIAAARLQQSVGELVRAHGGEMRLARVLDKGKIDGKAVVAFSFAISHTGLAPLLHAIEIMRPVTFIDSLGIRLNRVLDDGRAAVAAKVEDGPFRNDPILDVGLEASIYVASGGAR